MTPTGSFHGSNRLTWQTIGRFVSMPYCLQISWQNGVGELEVLHRQRVDARRRVTTRSISSDAGTNSSIVHTDAS